MNQVDVRTCVGHEVEQALSPRAWAGKQIAEIFESAESRIDAANRNVIAKISAIGEG